MAAAFYERLSSLDHSFLLFEGPNTYMHVAALAILDGQPLTTAAGGIDTDRIRRFIGSRLQYVPSYRQRLYYVPVENHPVWVDDEDFDIGYHVRHSSLPKPGTEQQLRELCARLLERPLDRRKPLWEIWVIEGLSGNRFALFMKVHHCMVDGIAGVGLMSAMFAMSPTDEIEAAAKWVPRPRPSDRDLLSGELRRRGRMSLAALSHLPRVLSDPVRAADGLRRRAGAFWEFVRTGMEGCARTSLNREIGPHRRIDWLTFDLDQVKTVKNRLGGTINDVVLATVAGAARRFLQRRGDRVDGDFRAGVPVNLRSTAHPRMGNHIWAWIVPLPIDVRDPRARVQLLHAETERLKRSAQAEGGQLITTAVEWTSSNLMPLGVRLLTRMQPYNILVTNVPGPPIPLYLLGARIDALYPYAPLFDRQALGIALFSYAGKLSWGIVGDWDAVPDLADFTNAIRRSFSELRRAAAISAPARGRQSHPRSRRSAGLAAQRELAPAPTLQPATAHRRQA